MFFGQLQTKPSSAKHLLEGQNMMFESGPIHYPRLDLDDRLVKSKAELDGTITPQSDWFPHQLSQIGPKTNSRDDDMPKVFGLKITGEGSQIKERYLSRPLYCHIYEYI